MYIPKNTILKLLGNVLPNVAGLLGFSPSQAYLLQNTPYHSITYKSYIIALESHAIFEFHLRNKQRFL